MKRWLTVQNRDNEPAVMVISGPIGKSWWDDTGVSSKEFHDELNKIPKGKAIHVRINSEGGSIKDGLEIYNALKDRRKDVTAFVDGYAVSIASVIPLAAGKVVSPKSSIWMLHEPWSMTQGNAEDHRHSADMLDKHGELLASIYAEETGKSKTEMRGIMQAETWMTGEEAVAFGLADESNDDDAKASLTRLDTRNFRNIPDNIYNMISAAKSGDNKPHTTAMNKKLVNLLKEHGIDATETETEEQLMAKLAKIPKAEKPKDPAKETPKDVIEEIRAIREEMRTDRITQKVNAYVDQCKITKDEIPVWVEAALKDEKKAFDILDKKDSFQSGGPPLGVSPSGIELISDPMGFLDRSTPEQRFPGTPMAEFRKKHTDIPLRVKAMKESWNQLFADACSRDRRKGLSPMGANTYSATLVTSFLLDGSLTPLQNRLAMMAAFTRDYSPDPYKPLATAVLKNPTAGATAQQDATNWESGNSTVGPISVTMHQQSVSDQVSNSDLNSGLRLEDLATINAAVFANTVIEKATAPITTANFQTTGGQTNLVIPAAAFGLSDTATLMGQLQKSTIMNLILDGTYIARISNTPGFFQTAGTINGGSSGWDKFGWDGIYLNSDWAGAEANVKGFACNPQAIVAVTGLPLLPPNIPGGILSTQTSTIPGVNISFAMSLWFNTGTRTMWCSWDVMEGIALGDATAGVLVKQA